MTTLPRVAAAAFALCLAACSPRPAETTDAALALEKESAPQPPRQGPKLTPQPKAAPATANVLMREGIGLLKIGKAVPAGSGWAERGAQIPGPCRKVSSPDFPGVYAIVEEGKVRRITIGERSTVKLVEGIGVGANEAEVRAAFPSFREEPHKYIEPPGKYLMSPSATSGDPALRFEIGSDGRVSLVHAGTMPVLGYVEGCA